MDTSESLRKMEDYFKVQKLLGTYGSDDFTFYELTGSISLNKVKEVAQDGVYVVPDFVTFIENGAIHMTEGLEYIKLGSNVKKINPWGLAHNKSLKHVELNEGILFIGESAFYSSGILELILPKSVTKIGGGIVRRCESLKKFIATDSLETCEQQIFSDSLEYIEFPKCFSSKLITSNKCKIIYV